MPDETPSIPLEEYLRLREETLWRELAALAPEKVRELQGIQQSRRNYEQKTVPSQPGPYSGMKNATDAVMAHLRTVEPFTLDRQTLECAVLDGGWGLHIIRRALNVRDAIRFRVKQGQIKEDQSGKLALPEQLTPESLPKTPSR